MTHLWWHADRTPEIDPLGDDQAAIERGRARVLAAADIVIPGHGAGVPRPRADPAVSGSARAGAERCSAGRSR